MSLHYLSKLIGEPFIRLKLYFSIIPFTCQRRIARAYEKTFHYTTKWIHNNVRRQQATSLLGIDLCETLYYFTILRW